MTPHSAAVFPLPDFETLVTSTETPEVSRMSQLQERRSCSALLRFVFPVGVFMSLHFRSLFLFLPLFVSLFFPDGSFTFVRKEETKTDRNIKPSITLTEVLASMGFKHNFENALVQHSAARSPFEFKILKRNRNSANLSESDADQAREKWIRMRDNIY